MLAPIFPIYYLNEDGEASQRRRMGWARGGLEADEEETTLELRLGWDETHG